MPSQMINGSSILIPEAFVVCDPLSAPYESVLLSQWKVASIRSADAAEDKRRERHERKLAEAAEKKALAKA